MCLAFGDELFAPNELVGFRLDKYHSECAFFQMSSQIAFSLIPGGCFPSNDLPRIKKAIGHAEVCKISLWTLKKC